MILEGIKECESTMKAKEIREMSDDALQSEAEEKRRHLYDLRCQAVTEKLENPHQLKDTRRDIARILTEQRQRQLAAAKGDTA